MKPAQQIEVTLPDSCSASEAQLLIDMAQIEESAADIVPICIRCHKAPSEIEEYVEIAHEEGMTPEDYVREEEGTFNSENGHFACTACYVAMGMPSRPYPDGWVAP